MNVSLKNFKVKPMPSEAEVEARAKKALERQLVDALALSSYPGGMKKHNKTNP